LHVALVLSEAWMQSIFTAQIWTGSWNPRTWSD